MGWPSTARAPSHAPRHTHPHTRAHTHTHTHTHTAHARARAHLICTSCGAPCCTAASTKGPRPMGMLRSHAYASSAAACIGGACARVWCASGVGVFVCGVRVCVGGEGVKYVVCVCACVRVVCERVWRVGSSSAAAGGGMVRRRRALPRMVCVMATRAPRPRWETHARTQGRALGAATTRRCQHNTAAPAA
jgi:hypothetical protein